MSDLRVNEFGEIACSVCGFNEGRPGANMVYICNDCRDDMKKQRKQFLVKDNPHE